MTQPTEPTPLNPADVFLHLIIAFLTPMFLATTGGDINLARAAAAHTVNAYTARHPADLLAIAQVIALGLAVLSSVSLSMTANLPVSLVLRLRGNANSLHRSAERARQALSVDTAAPQTRHEDDARAAVAQIEHQLAQLHAAAHTEDPPRPTPAEPAPPQPLPQEAAEAALHDSPQPIADPDATLLTAARPLPQAPTPADARHRRHAWATAMTRVARTCASNLDALPPTERRAASLRATMLSSVAQQLLCDPPAADTPPQP